MEAQRYKRSLKRSTFEFLRENGSHSLSDFKPRAVLSDNLYLSTQEETVSLERVSFKLSDTAKLVTVPLNPGPRKEVFKDVWGSQLTVDEPTLRPTGYIYSIQKIGRINLRLKPSDELAHHSRLPRL